MAKLLLLMLTSSFLLYDVMGVWVSTLNDVMGNGIAENTPIGTVLGTLYFQSPQGNTVVYSSNRPQFNVNSQTGVVSVAESLNYRTMNNMAVTFSAKDGANPAALIDVVVTILPVNHPPTFDSPSYLFSVRENVVAGTMVYNQINVIEQDSGVNGTVDVTCVSSGQTCSYFTVSSSPVPGFSNRTMVSLTITTPLNQNINPNNFQLRATDRGTPPLSSTANITFIVENSQDSRPVFLATPFFIQIVENQFSSGQNLVVMKVTDARPANNANGLRVVIEQDTLGIFSTVPIGTPSVGVYDVAIRQQKAFNLATNNFNPRYTFIVKAIQTLDGEDLPVYSQTLVTVNIQDVNDITPQFNLGQYSAFVSEGLANGATVPGLQMLVSDRDSGPNGRYALSLITSGALSGVFDVTPNVGQGDTAVALVVNVPSFIRYDPVPGRNTYSLIVKATETDTAERLTSTATITLTVIPPTDNRPPYFPNTFNPIILFDQTPVGSIISSLIKATDTDSGQNGVLKYSITNEDNSQTFFNIDQATGVLTLKTPLNASITPGFSFDVIATDGGGLSAFAPIRIDVLSTAGPIFKPPFYNARVTELNTNIIPQVKVLAEMGSLVSDRVVQYRLVEGSNFVVNNFFSIDPSGVVTLKNPVDYNQTPDRSGLFEFQVEASVVNNANIPTNRATVRISVTDTNNHAPVFKPSATYYKSINETTPPNTYVTTVTATDDDTGNNALVTYLMLDGAFNGFTVDNGGRILTTANAVLSPNRVYDMKVLAIDAGQPPLSATATVLINVTDVIKDPPTFDTNEFIFFIREDANVGTLIGSVTAQSSDARAKLRYVFVPDSWKAYDRNNILTSTPVWNWFSLDENTAQLQVQGTLSNSLAARATVNVSAQITNMEANMDRSTTYVLVTINILPVDANRDLVVFSPFRDSYYIEVLEKQAINTQVFQFSAIAIRTNTPIRNFKLTPTDPNQLDTFIVDTESGIMKVIRNVVYVQLANKNFTYNLEAIAAPPSNAKATAVVVVAILPLSPDPVFDRPEYTFDIKNTAPRSSYVGGVKATNPYPNQSPIRYSLVPPSNLFQIDPFNGSITLQQSLNSQQLLYSLFVRAQSSNATQSFSSNALVNIRVLADKTLRPYFESYPYRFPVPLSTSGPVARVVAFDPNPYNPSQMLYSIYNSTADGFFTIDQGSGIIQATRPLDRNATLVVVATAADNSSFSNHTFVYIQTYLPTSQTPTFTYPNVSSINILGSDPSFQLQVQGNPAVAGRNLKYYLDPSTSQEALNLFRIDQNTGLLTFQPGATIPLGFNSYQLVLMISDEFSTQRMRLTANIYGNDSPTFACYQSPFVFNASITPGLLTPALNITSVPGCTNNIPGTQYYYRITKINDVDYNTSPYRDWFVLSPEGKSAVYVNATTHLFFRDNLKYRLNLAVGNSESDLEQALQRTSSQLTSIVQIDPFFSPGPSFESTNPQCPGSGRTAITGILDLTPANSPVYRMVAGDCDADPARPNNYTIERVSYVGPENLYYGEPDTIDSDPFAINSLSGLVLTKLDDYRLYYRGHFDVVVAATSPYRKQDQAVLKVYMVREYQKRRITFNKPFLQATSQNAQFVRDLNRVLEPSSLTLVPDQVTTLVNNDGSRNPLASTMCYFTVDSSGRVVVGNDDVITQAVNQLNPSYAASNVVGDCSTRVASTEDWSGRTSLWWVLIAFSILVFIVALVLVCCVCAFWPMNVRKMAETRPYIVLNEPQTSMAGSVFDYKG